METKGVDIKMKKIIGLLLVFTMLCSISMNVYASENEEGKIVDGSVLTSDNYSEKICVNPRRGNILDRGAAKITNNGNGSVNIYGAVYGSVVCDEMILRMTLQRYVNGSWENIKTFTDTANNKSYLIKSYNVSVTKGYYYRLKAACVAKKNGVNESQAPVTNGIMIN